MGQESNKPRADEHIDMSRSENQQRQEVAGQSPAGEEKRMESSRDKGNPNHQHGDHSEGQYTKQSDNPTMHSSDADKDK